MSALPEAYLKLVMPLIDTARGFLESGESLQPFAFVGSTASGEMLPVMIDTQTADAKDHSAQLIKMAADNTKADFIFTVMEAWGLPRDKMPRYQEILDKYGSVGASPYKIDTAAFMLETRYGVWGCQAPLKPKGHSKKKRTFGPVELKFMDGVEGRFVGLLPQTSPETLH